MFTINNLRFAIATLFITLSIIHSSAHEYHNLDRGHQGQGHTCTNKAGCSGCGEILSHLLEFKGGQDLRRIQNSLQPDFPSAGELVSLGWAFVFEARLRQDESIHRHALDCADYHDAAFGASPDSKLLRGHCLLQFHRFKEAEDLARELMRERGNALDRTLLGDALLEQGQLAEAEVHYLAITRKRVGFEALARMAWLRWQQGRHAESIELWEQSLNTASNASTNIRAWCATHLAEAYFAVSSHEKASHYTNLALSLRPGYAKAAFLKGRLLWLNGNPSEGIAWIRQSVDIDPLVERLWWLQNILESQNQYQDAVPLFREIYSHGMEEDKRLTALFLAIRGIGLEEAERLAMQECATRQDCLTLAVYAFCLLRNGKNDLAKQKLDEALTQGPVDGRISLIAACIKSETGDPSGAETHLEIANRFSSGLTPSERTTLQKLNENTNT